MTHLRANIFGSFILFRRIFAEYDPSFSTGSLDEASLDVTDHLQSRALAGKPLTGAEVAEDIRRRIFEA